MENKEFNKLQRENERIRKELKLFIGDNGLISENEFKHIEIKINELINNEIEQEKFCCWNEEKKESYKFETISPDKKKCLGCGETTFI